MGSYGVFWDVGIALVSLSILRWRHRASCPILSSILLGTIRIVPSSRSGPRSHSFMGSVTSVQAREVLGSLVLFVLLRYCSGVIGSFPMFLWGCLSQASSHHVKAWFRSVSVLSLQAGSIV